MSLKIDFSHLRDLAKQEIDDANNKNQKDDKSLYPIVYPGANGKLTFKILFNAKANIIQRKIFRHGKLGCFQMYGEGCPICDAIKTVETINGRESGVFGKYGYKTRGICYAQIVKHDPAYFTEKNDPKDGDVVLLMYPKTVFEGISNIIYESGDNIASLVAENEGLAITIERSQKGNAAPSYNTYVYPYGKFKSFEDNEEKTGDQRFEELLESLPDLSETLVPKYPNEDVREKARAMSETITSEYINSSVINPGEDVDTEEKPEEKKAEPISNIVPAAPVSRSSEDSGKESDDTSGRPSCYGKHSSDPSDRKCLLCEHEADCYADTEG